MDTKTEAIKDNLLQRFNIGAETNELSLWEMAIDYYLTRGASQIQARQLAGAVCGKTAEAIAKHDDRA